jgi:hypothetical protein
MLRIKKVDENSKQGIIDFLRLDVFRHVFAFYDIQFEPQYTSMYVAYENEGLKRYVLIYAALDFPSVVLEGEYRAAEGLLDYAPRNRFIMHVPPDLLPAVKRKFPSANCYVENWMLLEKDEAKFLRSKLVRRLQDADDAAKLAALLSAIERPLRSDEEVLELGKQDADLRGFPRRGTGILRWISSSTATGLDDGRSFHSPKSCAQHNIVCFAIAGESVAGLCQMTIMMPRAGFEPVTSGDITRKNPLFFCQLCFQTSMR